MLISPLSARTWIPLTPHSPMSLANYFDVEKSFAFYGSFHYNNLNKLVHIICVPIIFTSSIELLSRVVPTPLVKAIALFYAVSFVKMDRSAGLAYAPVIAGMYYIATTKLAAHPTISLLAFVVSWVAQFAGHAFWERRAPALLTNLPQSLHAAVFFVWLEVAFALGFRRPLRVKLEAAVEKERRARRFT